MAEIEIGVMARQCLDRRISDQSTLRREIEAWQDRRNRDTIRVNWRFTTADARIKLKSLYPSIQNCWTTSYHNYVCTTFADQYTVQDFDNADCERLVYGSEAHRVLEYLVPFEGLPPPRPLDAQRVQQRLLEE